MAKSHYQRKLEEKLLTEISNRSIAIAEGGLQDFAAYKFETGYLTGLRQALKLVEETEQEMT